MLWNLKISLELTVQFQTRNNIKLTIKLNTT